MGLLQSLTDILVQTLAAAELTQLDLRVKRLLGSLDIAGVGEKIGLSGRHQHGTVGERKAAGIALILFVAYQQSVKPRRDEFFLDFFRVVHSFPPSVSY